MVVRLEELTPQTFLIEISEEDVNQIDNISKVIVKSKVSTLDQFGDDFVWLLNHHGIDVKLSAILD